MLRSDGARPPVMEIVQGVGRGPFPSADPPSSSVRVHAGSSCVCHCPAVPCVWAGRGGQGLSSGAAPWISSLVCLSVRLSLFPGVLCHRSPPRLIRPCSSRSPPVPVAPHCVSPPFRVTSHCPGAPALPPRTPAFQPARPPTLWPPRAQRRVPGPGRCLRSPPARRKLTFSGSYVAAQPLAPAVRRASGAHSGKPSKTWSRVVSQSC